MSFEVTRLTAVNTPQTITTPVHEVDGVSSFVAMTDYVYVIYASDPYQIVTVEVWYTFDIHADQITVKLQWLHYFWVNENMFETGAVRANECYS